MVGALNLTSEELLNALLAVGILTDDDVRDCHKELAAASGSMTDATPAATRLVKSGELTKFQATQVLGGKAKALVMGDYVILDKIGAGGMGLVCTIQSVSVVLKTGDAKRLVVRETDCIEKRNGEWKLIHQPASVPSGGEWDGKVATA
jgi:hypothetical protein